jgi:hypothetical protein
MKALYAALFVLVTSCFVEEGPAPDHGYASPEEPPTSTLLSVCGNNLCDGQERPETCPQDCSECGDGRCLLYESISCPQDCCFMEPCTGG